MEEVEVFGTFIGFRDYTSDAGSLWPQVAEGGGEYGRVPIDPDLRDVGDLDRVAAEINDFGLKALWHENAESAYVPREEGIFVANLTHKVGKVVKSVLDREGKAIVEVEEPAGERIFICGLLPKMVLVPPLEEEHLTPVRIPFWVEEDQEEDLGPEVEDDEDASPESPDVGLVETGGGFQIVEPPKDPDPATWRLVPDVFFYVRNVQEGRKGGSWCPMYTPKQDLPVGKVMGHKVWGRVVAVLDKDGQKATVWTRDGKRHRVLASALR